MRVNCDHGIFQFLVACASHIRRTIKQQNESTIVAATKCEYRSVPETCQNMSERIWVDTVYLFAFNFFCIELHPESFCSSFSHDRLDIYWIQCFGKLSWCAIPEPFVYNVSKCVEFFKYSLATGLTNFCDEHDSHLFFEHETAVLVAEVVKSNEIKQIVDQFWSWKVIFARTLCHFFVNTNRCLLRANMPNIHDQYSNKYWYMLQVKNRES